MDDRSQPPKGSETAADPATGVTGAGDVGAAGSRTAEPTSSVSDPAVHLARANVYRLLAAATLAPDDPRARILRDEEFREVVAAALEWIRDDPLFHAAELGPGELSPGEIDPRLSTPDGEAPGDAYWRVFGHSISKDCPPYELEYYPNTDINFRSQRLADVGGFYRAFGLARAEEAKERIDHLSFEAEFMQIVIARELWAREHDLGEERAETSRRAQRRFFVEHLGWWLPSFGCRLSERVDSSFYGELGVLARAFVATERAVLGVAPFTELPDVHVDPYEAEGGCFECGLETGDPGPDGPAPTACGP